jgi:Amt family ammonium transporter
MAAAMPDTALLLSLLAPLAAAGLLAINTGLSRSRSAAHTATASLCAAGAAVLAYFVCGFALAEPGGGGKWLGSGPFFLTGFDFGDLRASALLPLQIFSVALAAMIPAGTLAERWRLPAVCASSAIFAGWTFPLFSHWAWSGWLSAAGFLDAGGAGAVHAAGGLTALALAWIAGPRRGKFPTSGMPFAMPGHNAVIVLFGCVLALVGWLGLNLSTAALVLRAEPGDLVRAAVNTALSAAAAALAAWIMTRIRFGRPDASLIANGWVGGLVATSASAPFLAPALGVLTGAIAGLLVVFSVELFETRLRVDDPSGGVSVHGIAGLWGLLAAGIWAHAPFGPPAIGQWAAQLAGIATLLGCILPLSYALNWLLDRLLPYRVPPEAERQGMDLSELGAGAYPEFVTHREDLLRR